jgi:hypothetical protein
VATGVSIPSVFFKNTARAPRRNRNIGVKKGGFCMKVIVKIDGRTVYEGSLADLYNLKKINIGGSSFEGSSGFVFEVKDGAVLIEYCADWTMAYVNGKEVKTPKGWMI